MITGIYNKLEERTDCMGLFDLFRRKTQVALPETREADISEPPYVHPRVDFTMDISEEEKETVSVVASAIAAGSWPDSSFRIKSIRGIDTGREIAAAIVSAVMAGERPDSRFRLVSVTEVKNER